MKRNQFEDADIDGKIKLKWILKRYGVKKWIGLTGFQCCVKGKPYIYPYPWIWGGGELKEGRKYCTSISIMKIRNTLRKLFLYPENFRIISKNSLKLLKHKFVNKFSGCPPPPPKSW
jgi:hypothetical protein